MIGYASCIRGNRCVLGRYHGVSIGYASCIRGNRCVLVRYHHIGRCHGGKCLHGVDWLCLLHSRNLHGRIFGVGVGGCHRRLPTVIRIIMSSWWREEPQRRFRSMKKRGMRCVSVDVIVRRRLVMPPAFAAIVVCNRCSLSISLSTCQVHGRLATGVPVGLDCLGRSQLCHGPSIDSSYGRCKKQC